MNETCDDITTFKKWLVINGAKFPKIEWPSLDTTGGVRGATAIQNIATNEVMIEIPGHLMMSPPVAYASEIGTLLRQNSDLLRTDLLLSVYIMSERSKSVDSFFYPFLRILPEPGTIANWDDKDLLQLQVTRVNALPFSSADCILRDVLQKIFQDDALHVRAKGRLILVESTYNRTVVVLSQRCPEEFPLDKFSFENFKFAWFSIMARAFGKRLPWTALVPFADCLNHGNLQTKYDYDVNENGLFRLFPSGTNGYTMGSEVFNSYGRRANDNLLLDYGFAMLDNEWDTYEVMLVLPPNSPLQESKKEVLCALGYSSSLSVTLSKKNFPISAIAFLRIVLLTEDELNYLLQTLPPLKVVSDGPETLQTIFNRTPASISRDDKRRCFNKILSVSNELSAMKMLSSVLQACVDSWPTTAHQDELLLAAIIAGTVEEQGDSLYEKSVDGVAESVGDAKVQKGVEEAEKWKLQCSVTYRLTRKRIIGVNLEKLSICESFLLGRLASKSDTESDYFDVQSLSLSDSNPFITEKRILKADEKRKEEKLLQENLSMKEPQDVTRDGDRDRDPPISSSAKKASSSPKMSMAQRDLAALKADVDLYLKQVNSHDLNLHITVSP